MPYHYVVDVVRNGDAAPILRGRFFESKAKFEAGGRPFKEWSQQLKAESSNTNPAPAPKPALLAAPTQQLGPSLYYDGPPMGTGIVGEGITGNQ